jgi:DNA-binding PadR family transcriptional regulator
MAPLAARPPALTSRRVAPAGHRTGGLPYPRAITRRLNDLGFAGVIEGTVYTILLRLEKNGLVQVTKRPSGMGPPRKFYALNDAGREELATFWAKWEYLSSRIDKLKEGGR